MFDFDKVKKTVQETLGVESIGRIEVAGSTLTIDALLVEGAQLEDVRTLLAPRLPEFTVVLREVARKEKTP